MDHLIHKPLTSSLATAGLATIRGCSRATYFSTNLWVLLATTATTATIRSSEWSRLAYFSSNQWVLLLLQQSEDVVEPLTFLRINATIVATRILLLLLHFLSWMTIIAPSQMINETSQLVLWSCDLSFWSCDLSLRFVKLESTSQEYVPPATICNEWT